MERAERLREVGKLPKAFDWSRLESEDSGADMEELVSRLLFSSAEMFKKPL